MYPYGQNAPRQTNQSVPTMRYNPYIHSRKEKEFIYRKNNPNTFNNVFSRDVRVSNFFNLLLVVSWSI